MAIIGQDYFTDTDGTSLVDHVPNVGNAWLWTGEGTPTGAIQIYDNKLSVDTEADPDYLPYYLNIDPIANCTILAVIGGYTPLCFALYGRINLDTGKQIVVYPKAGHPRTIWIINDGYNMEEFSVSATIGTTVKMKISGSTVEVYFDDALVETFTTEVLAAGYIGISAMWVIV